ncbi:MAG: hypothetical protein J6R04_07920 [Clostridia bacterium]|nr:hypothetical protein [Clostridia bacterium]
MMRIRMISICLILVLSLVLCACRAVTPPDALPDESSAPQNEEPRENQDNAPTGGTVARGNAGVGCVFYRTPFDGLRGEAEYIILGTVTDVQRQSSAVDYVTVAVEQTYRAYGEQTFETVRIHQMVTEDSLADHVGKTCLLFLKKHPADTTDVFYGVDSMKGIMLYDEQTHTLSVYETSFVCDALGEWLMDNVSGGETVRVIDIHEMERE